MDTMDLVGKLADDTATALGVERSQIDYITAEGVYEILSKSAPLIKGMVKYEIVEYSQATVVRYVDVYNPMFAGHTTAYCPGYAAYNNGQYRCAPGPFTVYGITAITPRGRCLSGGNVCGNVYRLSF